MTERLQDLEQQLADLAAAVDGDEAKLALGVLATAQLKFLAKCMTSEATNGRPAEDRLLTAKEAAKVLGIDNPRSLYRNKNWPFRVQVSKGQVRFSMLGIQRYIKEAMKP